LGFQKVSVAAIYQQITDRATFGKPLTVPCVSGTEQSELMLNVDARTTDFPWQSEDYSKAPETTKCEIRLMISQILKSKPSGALSLAHSWQT